LNKSPYSPCQIGASHPASITSQKKHKTRATGNSTFPPPDTNQPADPTVPYRQHGHACCAVQSLCHSRQGSGDGELAGDGRANCCSGVQLEAATTNTIPRKFSPSHGAGNPRAPERAWFPQSPFFCACGRCGPACPVSRRMQQLLIPGPVSTLTDHTPHRADPAREKELLESRIECVGLQTSPSFPSEPR
jgi:hypothetical protein